MPRNYLTPPYVTALPVIVHHTLDSRDAFMVLATDGLWDEIESEDAVAMLADFSEGRKPVGIAQKDTYVKMDGNAATHLIRNGFGGGNHVRVQQLLRLQPPISRRYRDDVTTTVVFFDPEVLEAASKGDKAALEKMAQAKAAGQMMVVDRKKGDPRGKTPRMDKWLKMAETERRAAKL
jgi:pyruvate dehydrogenase phosphatase